LVFTIAINTAYPPQSGPTHHKLVSEWVNPTRLTYHYCIY